MELKVSKELHGNDKFHSEIQDKQKYVSWALFLKLQTAEINFEKLLG